MKQFRRKLAAVLLAGMLMGNLAPTVSAQAMDTMPAAFDTEPDRSYASPCESRFDEIPAALLALVPEADVEAWRNFNAVLRTETPVTLMEYPNIYSFIQVFELSEEDVRAAMEPALAEENAPLTAEELDLILNGSQEEILAHFKTEYPIILGDHFYTARWLYEHTTEEYVDAHISPEMVAEQLPVYPDFPFRLEAAIAFSDKLYSYVGSAAGQMQWGFLAGDVDQDGALGVRDIVLMQRYLLKTQTITYSQWAAGDLDGDDAVDVMDLGMLKHKVLTTQSAEPPGTVLLNVMVCNQHPDYPTGCESVSLYMLLRYYDVDVTIDQIVDALPKGPLPYTKDGVLYGPDPEKVFVGDPRDSSSYGVFNEPLRDVAEQFLPGAKTAKGVPLEDVIALLDKGSPAVVWYTTDPDRGIIYRRQWTDPETGNLIRWPGGEHAVVVCGHDETNIYYRDPNTGSSVMMDREEFRKIYDELGGRVVYYD